MLSFVSTHILVRKPVPTFGMCFNGDGDELCEGNFPENKAGSHCRPSAVRSNGVCDHRRKRCRPHRFCRAFGNRLSRSDRERYRTSGEAVLHQRTGCKPVCAVAGSGDRQGCPQNAASRQADPRICPWGAIAGQAWCSSPLVFTSGTLVITAMGTPLESGAAGDFIKIRNIDSGIIVSGTVLADGRIQVGMQ